MNTMKDDEQVKGVYTARFRLSHRIRSRKKHVYNSTMETMSIGFFFVSLVGKMASKAQMLNSVTAVRCYDVVMLCCLFT